MILNNKPVVPAGAFLRRYSNTSNLFKILAILAKRRKALWSSAVGFLKKPLSSCREFANCCIKASALLDDVKIGSTMNQKRRKNSFTITELLTTILTSDCLRNLMVAHELFK